MTENLRRPNLLLKSKTNLLRMREEVWLSEAEIATVDRGIAALDRLVTELSMIGPVETLRIPLEGEAS